MSNSPGVVELLTPAGHTLRRVTDEQHARVDEGLLVWDGRVLELFRSDGGTKPWRLHVGVIRRCEIEERKKGIAQLKVWDHERHWESVMFASEELEVIRQIVGEIDRQRAT
mgnify:CR=1 FL=1